MGKGFDVDADGPGFVADGFTQRHVEVAGDTGLDGGFGHGHGLHGVDALFRFEDGDRAAVAGHGEVAAGGGVVGAGFLMDVIEPEGVAADLGGVAGAHAQVLFDFVTFDQGNAGNEDGDAEVGDDHALIGAGQMDERWQQAVFSILQAIAQADQGGGEYPQGHQQAEGDQRGPFAHGEGQQERGDDADAKGPFEADHEGRGRRSSSGRRWRGP